MSLADFIGYMGSYLFVELGASILSLFIGLFVCVRLMQRKATNGFVLALPGMVIAMAVIGLAALGNQSETVEGVSLVLGARLLGWLVIGPSALVVLIFGTVAGLRAETREWKVAGIVAVFAALACTIPWVYGVLEEDYLLVGTRSVLYLLGGVLCAIASVGVSESAGRDPGVAAAAAFAVLVAGGELMQRAVSYAMLYLSVGLVNRDAIPLFYETSREAVIVRLSPWDHVTMVCGLCPLIVLVALAIREDGARNRAIMALPVLLIAPCLYLTGEPTVAGMFALYDATH